jgi:hypothetical protein
LATEHCRTSGYTFQTSFRFDDSQGFLKKSVFNSIKGPREDRSLKRRDLGMLMDEWNIDMAKEQHNCDMFEDFNSGSILLETYVDFYLPIT